MNYMFIKNYIYCKNWEGFFMFGNVKKKDLE